MSEATRSSNNHQATGLREHVVLRGDDEEDNDHRDPTVLLEHEKPQGGISLHEWSWRLRIKILVGIVILALLWQYVPIITGHIEQGNDKVNVDDWINVQGPADGKAIVMLSDGGTKVGGFQEESMLEKAAYALSSSRKSGLGVLH